MAAFPAGMLYLSFGDAFNHPVEGLNWPADVSTLTLGRAFNQKVADTVWPTALREVHELGFFTIQPTLLYRCRAAFCTSSQILLFCENL